DRFHGSASLLLEIAKGSDATEIVIQEFLLIIKDYKQIPPGKWEHRMMTLTYPKAFDYYATLDPELTTIHADNENPTNPQITEKFSVPIHLHLNAFKPGIYTFVC